MLQLEHGAEHGGAAAKAVVVGVGVNAIEDGIGIMTLVQEVVEFQAEDKTLPFILSRGVEERHVLVLVRSDLSAYVVVA